LSSETGIQMLELESRMSELGLEREWHRIVGEQ
jgi:hypothetical protein